MQLLCFPKRKKGPGSGARVVMSGCKVVVSASQRKTKGSVPSDYRVSLFLGGRIYTSPAECGTDLQSDLGKRKKKMFLPSQPSKNHRGSTLQGTKRPYLGGVGGRNAINATNPDRAGEKRALASPSGKGPPLAMTSGGHCPGKASTTTTRKEILRPEKFINVLLEDSRCGKRGERTLDRGRREGISRKRGRRLCSEEGWKCRAKFGLTREKREEDHIVLEGFNN